MVISTQTSDLNDPKVRVLQNLISGLKQREMDLDKLRSEEQKNAKLIERLAAEERLEVVYQSEQQKAMNLSVQLGEAQARAAFYKATSKVYLLLAMNTTLKKKYTH